MELLKKWLRNFLKKHEKSRLFVRKVHVKLKEHNYLKAASKIALNEKKVIFETFMGRQYGCNPKAIYEQMIADSAFDDYEMVWVLNDLNKAKEIPELDRAKIVSMRSKDYYRHYASSKYVVTNSNLDYGITKKEGQVFLQTWHGTPLKKLRCDIEAEKGNVLNSLDEIRQKNDLDVVRYDYFVSPSKFCTDKFRSAFNLVKLGKENIIIETGYPRNDLLFDFDSDFSENLKLKLGLANDKKIILYAPTFRDNRHDGSGYVYDVNLDFDRLRQELASEYIILFRAHYFVANQFNFNKYKGFVYDVSGLDDITPLYTITDLLITDYSSVLFDFANLRRPMIFYMYDLEEYEKDIRGFYLDIDELPGAIVRTENELLKAIKTVEKSQSLYIEKYEKFNEKYNALDDGYAGKRVVDIIMEK